MRMDQFVEIIVKPSRDNPGMVLKPLNCPTPEDRTFKELFRKEALSIIVEVK